MGGDELIARATRYALSGADNERYTALREFCRGRKKILSVGSAGYEPRLIGATHALDVSEIAGKFLRDGGWAGEFTVGSCTDLPFKNKFFDCCVCSEVVEHLPNIGAVETTLNELDRVCSRWLVTTPCVKVPEPDHKILLTEDQVRAMCAKLKAGYYIEGLWFFIEGGKG